MGKFKISNRGLYWGLIATFGLLYVLVAFVSTLHAIDFFKLSNAGGLAVLLGIAYEVGQASVLFSILMTKNKEKFLPWLLMILLTALQVTANVYASFKHMSLSGNNDWTYWYTSILKIFGVQGGNAETYQVIISWISGALLPIVALGMTALVAQNIKLISEESGGVENEPIPASDIVSEISRVRPTEEDLIAAEAILSRKRTEKSGGYFEKEIPLQKKYETEEEIQKIKKLMKSDPIESGIISDTLKKTISPGLDLEEDMGDSPREQLSKIINEPVLLDTFIKQPVNEPTTSNEVLPALSDEEVTQMFHDELEGKLIDEENEEESSITQPPVVELPIVETTVVEPTPTVKYNTSDTVEEIKSDQQKEIEEEKLERLRHIARENLKKK